jgi:LuxR family maltose regulon positive regulatory protein
VVARFNPNLAPALTGRRATRTHFSHAEERGPFVIRIGPVGWCEIHSLVRAALIAELRVSATEHLIELHVRAAHWFEQADEVPVALGIGCPPAGHERPSDRRQPR